MYVTGTAGKTYVIFHYAQTQRQKKKKAKKCEEMCIICEGDRRLVVIESTISRFK